MPHSRYASLSIYHPFWLPECFNNMEIAVLNPINSAIISPEELILERFVLLLHYNIAHKKFVDNIQENQKHSIRLMSLELEPYLPDSVEEFDQGKSDIYRLIIRQFLLSIAKDEKTYDILTMTDPFAIQSLSTEAKLLRKKFSDAVSNILRRIKYYIYGLRAHLKDCTICENPIDKLIAQCLYCKNVFHFECISKQSLVCTVCGKDLH